MSARRAILLAALVTAAACSGDNGDGGQEPAEGDILVRNNFFDPSTFEVAPGATVVSPAPRPRGGGGGRTAHIAVKKFLISPSSNCGNVVRGM